MDYVYLGNTGMKVSPICLGTMQFGWSANEDTSMAIMNKAWDLGINFFDTANVYSRWSDKSHAGKSEEIIGRWLKESGNRDDMILATKVRGQMGEGVNDMGLSRRHIIREVNASLKRLKTKWIDLYQSHSSDSGVPIGETLKIYTDLIADHKVNAIGASNYTAWRLAESIYVSRMNGYAEYQTLQPYYALVRRHRFEPELVEVVKKFNIAVIPYSPLAGGFLTGKYKRDEALPESQRAETNKTRYFSDRGFAILDLLREITTNKGITVAQGALAWVMQQSTITSPIIGANTVAQLEDTVGALEVEFTEDELKQLDEVSSIDSNLIIK
jgi:aryl-alcohol dehydrogenase-like predicted oxidoreductase